MSLSHQNHPICADDFYIHEANYQDIDQQAACLTQYDQRYQQLSAGEYKGWFRTIQLSKQVTIYFETFNQKLDQWGACPADQYSFLFLENSISGLFNNRHFGIDHILVMSPGSSFDFTALAGTQFCVVSISAKIFESYFHSFTQDYGYLPHFKGQITLLSDHTCLSILRQMINLGVKLANANNSTHTKYDALNSYSSTLTSFLMSLFIRHAPHDNAQIIDQNQSDLKLALKARKYLRSTVMTNDGIIDLVEAMGVSRRRLEIAFRGEFDKSPAQYIKLMKLNAIRSALLNRDEDNLSIGDIAAKYGIWHLGRLAQNYYQHFGELPSTTRSSGLRCI